MHPPVSAETPVFPYWRKDHRSCRHRPCHIGDPYAVAVALGLSRYFTGKPCRNGHVCFRITRDRKCLVCYKDQKRRWAKKKPRVRRGKRRSPEAERLRQHRRRQNPVYREKARLKSAASYHRLTPEQKRERREKSLVRWAERDPEGYRRYKKAKKARNRARRRGAGGTYTLDHINGIFKGQKGRCAYFRKCRTRLGMDYHVDHIKPICLGGTNDPSNIQLTCPACNWTKNGQDPVDFARGVLGLLL